MLRRSVLVALCVVVSACGSRAGAASPTGSPAAFRHLVGAWVGHTGQLDIRRDGTVHEVVDDGCCHTIIDMRLRIVAVSGTPLEAAATTNIVSIKHVNKPVLAENHVAAPRIGERDVLHLRQGIVTDAATHVTFCMVSPPLPGSPCGA